MIRSTAEKSTLPKILSLLRRHTILIILSFIMSALSVALTLYAPVLIGDAIDLMLGKGMVELAVISRILCKLAVVIGLAAATQWLMGVLNNRIAFLVVEDIRNRAFCKIQSLPLSFIDSHKSGDIVSRVVADADQFSEGLLLGFSQLFSGVITIIGTLIFMFSISGWITLAVVFLTPISLLLASFIARRTYSLFRKQSELRGEQTAYINESVNFFKVEKAYSMEKKSIKRFEEINRRLTDCSLNATFFSSLVNPSTRFINSLVYAAVLLIGALSSLSIGAISCILNYSSQYAKPFNEISGVITELQNAFACADRIFELLEQPSAELDDASGYSFGSVEGNAEFKNVEFSYDKAIPLIKNLNLRVKAGQRVAIVGPTGCGKTTLINLLMRFYDVDRGTISIDGVDINSATKKSLRQSFGMVLQDTWIKNGTVKENIAFGRKDAADAEIIEAAKKAHAHSFIKRLPNGYDTVISDVGGLSVGQKQLLCIARVMLNIPPMLILDEATSSIDTRTEKKISDAFAVMLAGRTSFIVAHRLSTIQDADIILVMKDGDIIEQGSHSELLSAKGFYHTLYNSQFG